MGCLCLRTNIKLTALQVVLRYRNLLAVEQGFLAAKTLLATRPMFHRTDAAIRGHIFCTFLALVLRKELMDRLGSAPSRACRNGSSVVDDLLDLSDVEVEQDGRRALLRTAPRPSIDPLCRPLGLTLPPVFQELPTRRNRPTDCPNLWCLNHNGLLLPCDHSLFSVWWESWVKSFQEAKYFML